MPSLTSDTPRPYGYDYQFMPTKKYNSVQSNYLKSFNKSRTYKGPIYEQPYDPPFQPLKPHFIPKIYDGRISYEINRNKLYTIKANDIDLYLNRKRQI